MVPLTEVRYLRSSVGSSACLLSSRSRVRAPAQVHLTFLLRMFLGSLYIAAKKLDLTRLFRLVLRVRLVGSPVFGRMAAPRLAPPGGSST